MGVLHFKNQGCSLGASRPITSVKVKLARSWSLVPMVLDPLKIIVICYSPPPRLGFLDRIIVVIF